jgi:hypothetical protein
MKLNYLISIFFFLSHTAYADLKYLPLKFELKTDKEIYKEGEIISLKIVISNIDKHHNYPVLVPKSGNNGLKLFYLEVYDVAKNTSLMRYQEEKTNNINQEKSAYEIRYLKPLESIEIPFYLNETDTSSIFNHQIGVPLFAGIYQFRINYQTLGIKEASPIFHFYNHSEEEIPLDGKMAMPSSGLLSNFLQIKIKRTSDTIVNISGKNYYIKPNGDRHLYLTENLAQIVTDERCVHITNIPPDSCSANREYFYSYFKDLYTEYVNRFNDGDIIEYRKFRNECPDYLYTEKFNENKQKTFWALQLNDKSFYKVSYIQPGDKLEQETFCTFQGTSCKVITYIYDKNGILKNTKTELFEECMEVEIDGKKHYYKAGIEELDSSK